MPGRTGERVGVFGGTFDPPHVGHLAAAVNVRYTLALDRVLLVVANVPWQKVGTRPLSPAEDRLAMCEAAAAGVDGLEVSDIEVRHGGPSYTVDTLRALASCEPAPELFLVLGDDAAAGLGSWDRADQLPALATLVLVTRPGVEPARPGPAWRTLRVEVPHLEVSSTELRRRADDGRPLDFLTPAGVVSVIEQRRLYRGPTS